MGGFMGGGGGAPPPPPPPAPNNAEVEATRKKEQLAMAKRKGRSSTILTSGLGDTGEANTSKAVLG